MTADPTLLHEIRHFVAGQFDLPPEDIAAETHFYEDLDDSLVLAEVVVACEERWEVRIPEADYAAITTVGQLADLIAAALAEKASASPLTVSRRSATRAPWRGA